MIHTDIREQIKDAMKAKDTLRLNTLRGLLTAFTNELVATKHKPDEILEDEQALTVIKRQVKQRSESIEQFESAGRTDLSEKEKAEKVILEAMLPAMMSEAEVETFVQNFLANFEGDKSKLGIVIGAVMKELKGKADGGVVKAVVEKNLG